MQQFTQDSRPPESVIWGFARLLMGIDTDALDNGCGEPWRTIGGRLAQCPVDDRPEVLKSELSRIDGLDAGEVIASIFAIDPTLELSPDTEVVQPAALPPAVAFPINALPRSLADYVREGAAAIDCPPEYIAVPLLACVGSAIGTTVRVQINSEWYEGASLYTAVVAPSGAKKTPALRYALRFTHDQTIEYDLEHQRNLVSYEQEMAKYREAVEAHKRSKDKSEAVEPPAKPKRPSMNRVLVGDATVEAMGKRLKENPRGLLMERDELAALLLGLNQYKGGRGSDMQFYMSVWSREPVCIDRKGDDDPIVLHDPCLSITGGIQPGILPRILGRERLEDGCTARFLFCDPEPLPHRPSHSEAREETRERARRVYASLLKISHAQPYQTPPQPQLVRLTAGARARFTEWHERIGDRLSALSDDDPFRPPLSKMPGYLGRLALICHVVNWVEQEIAEFADISEHTMTQAIALTDYFIAHAERVWRRLVESTEDMQMRRLLRWMERKRHPVNVREILQSGVAGLKRSKEAEAVLGRMTECGLIKPLQVGRTTRYATITKSAGVVPMAATEEV